MQFLSIFRQITWVRMLKRFNKARILCPVCFSEEMIVVFQIKKSEIDTENEKNPKIFLFSNFSRNFIQLSESGFECFEGSPRKRLVVQ